MPQPLQYVQPLFLEERPVASWLGRGGTILAAVLVVNLIAALVGNTLLWRRSPSWLHGLMLVEVIFLAAVFVMLRQSRALIILETTDLQLRLCIGGLTFWRRTIRLSDVRSVEPIDSYTARSVLQLAGRHVQFMTGKTNVRLNLQKAKITIGSVRPDALLESLRNALTQSASPEAR